MKKYHHFWKRTMGALLAVLVVCSACLMPQSAQAVTQAQIDALKKDASSLNSKRQELASKLNKLSDDKQTAMEKKQLYDQQIANTEAQIGNCEEQIAEFEELIAEAEANLADAQEREEAQYDLFCKRVRAMEEQGTVSYWSILFKATSFSDLLGRLDMINEIMDSDQRIIDGLQVLQNEISEKEAVLQEEKTASEEVKADLEVKRGELEEQRNASTALIRSLAQDEASTEAELDGMEEEEEAIQAKIQKLTKELQEQQERERLERERKERERKEREAAAAAAAAAAAGGNSSGTSSGTTSGGSGGYAWPVSSHYITSTFGGRASPGGIGSTNHKGIDIGRVGYTTPVKAAKAGTVIVATYSSSYGNYVVISHSGGSTTLYGHMSSLKVSEGQSVSQGTVLGITGSTGNSTGPHLHFEITEGGARINPLKYLSGYTLAS